ncbi:MAG: ribonuclease HIII [Erysipelotrichaceae bacterium]|jgi:ribonuclease HIII|nr:ribonuclease HIII [Erysipelotrichia bacterium]
MKTYTFTADKKTIQEITSYFNKEDFSIPSDYMLYKISRKNLSIIIYKSDKVVIQGKEAKRYFEMFRPLESLLLPQAGSDEVGTGDFFGPVCVCASYLDEKTYQIISGLNLTDSKKLTDEYILKIAPKLIRNVKHSLLILDNEKYNQVIEDNNLNQIKAKLHNQAYINLRKKIKKLPEIIIVDDFCGEEKYYQYLKNEKTIKNIHFETKAETKYLSVAIAAIISRYAFLTKMNELSDKYQMLFPKGAGTIVDDFTKEFVNRYGLNELKKVAKLNFKNAQRI